MYYKVDYYINTLKLAIEYDEEGHKYYSYEQEGGRQKYIENKLGCKFLRLSNKNSDEYNMGLVIKEVIDYK